ncbi:MAG: response regulator transcription factor [Bacteroidota bacterium]
MTNARILVIDDHIMFQESLVRVIRMMPESGKVKGVSSANEAFGEIEKEVWDLILLDIEMPVMNGLGFLEALLGREVRPAVIMLSTHERDDFVQRSYSLGARGYVLKTGDTQELKMAIGRVLGGGFYFTQKIQNIIFNEVVSDHIFKKSLPALSARELDVLRLICKQKTGKEIADSLCIALATVSVHRANLLKKTKCVNMAGLVKFAIDNGYNRD